MSPTYQSWTSMKQRCNNPKSPDYKWYGARGITYNPSWENFEWFLLDMGERPPNTTLERSNNNGNYTKSNCSWATQKEQHNNKRSNHLITANGETRTMAQWADHLGVSPARIKSRVKNGWTDNEVVNGK